MREPYQVLIILYNYENGELKVCIFHRMIKGYWQFVSGGKDSADVDLYSAMKRELYEETGIDASKHKTYKLETTTSIAGCMFKEKFVDCPILITESVYAIEYSEFNRICLSNEHDEFRVVSYDDAMELLKWDSNKVALYELYRKLKQDKLMESMVLQ